jgi:flagellar motility protein MotE (MotC chaperone)
MTPDERADILEEMDEEAADEILEAIPRARTRRDGAAPCSTSRTPPAA